MRSGVAADLRKGIQLKELALRLPRYFFKPSFLLGQADTSAQSNTNNTSTSLPLAKTKLCLWQFKVKRSARKTVRHSAHCDDKV